MTLTHRRSFVRDAAVATAVLVSAYVAAQELTFQALQIPGYLLVVGFDVIESVVGPTGGAYPVAFAAYLAALGLGGAAVARALRDRSRDGRSAWRLGAAGALGVMGAIAVLFALVVLVDTSQTEPVLVAGAVGLALLGLAGWLAGTIEVDVNW